MVSTVAIPMYFVGSVVQEEFGLINHGNVLYPEINVSKVEEKYRAKFICETQIRSKEGGWSDIPVQIYHQPMRTDPSHNEHFAIYIYGDHLMIADGSSAAEPMDAVRIKSSGEIIYSRFRHDFRGASTANVFVDGGRDYIRIVGDPALYERVRLGIVGDGLVVLDEDEIDPAVSPEYLSGPGQSDQE